MFNEYLKLQNKISDMQRRLAYRRKQLHILAENALNDACGLTNPIVAAHSDIVQIFKNAF